VLALFDLDQTLVDRMTAFRRWAEEFCGAQGLPPETLPWLIQLDGGGFAPREALFGPVRERFGLDTPMETLIEAFRTGLPTYVECYPGVPAALAGLRGSGWRVGIVTNGSLLNQLGKIRNAGLADAVDGWAISGEIGVRKPDRRLFAEAAHRCGVSLDAGGWMVGDNPEADIAGGRGAGLRTVWIHHDQPWPDGEPEPDHRAPDVAAAAGIML